MCLNYGCFFNDDGECCKESLKNEDECEDKE